jgi:hypothetical protein
MRSPIKDNRKEKQEAKFGFNVNTQSFIPSDGREDRDEHN